MTPLRNAAGLDLVSVRRCPHGVVRRAWYASERDRRPVERMDVVAWRMSPWRTCRECDGKGRRK